MASKKTAKKATKKAVKPDKPDKGEWTTMYIPKTPVPDLITQLHDMLVAESPYQVTIPRYAVLEIALKEAIDSRS